MLALHRQELLERVGGDAELADELLDLFSGEAVRLRDAVRDAIGRGDTAAVAESAHSLKGSAGNVSALGVHEAALALEVAGRNGAVEGAEAAFEQLSTAIDAFLEHLGRPPD